MGKKATRKIIKHAWKKPSESTAYYIDCSDQIWHNIQTFHPTNTQNRIKINLPPSSSVFLRPFVDPPSFHSKKYQKILLDEQIRQFSLFKDLRRKPKLSEKIRPVRPRLSIVTQVTCWIVTIFGWFFLPLAEAPWFRSLVERTLLLFSNSPFWTFFIG